MTIIEHRSVLLTAVVSLITTHHSSHCDSSRGLSDDDIQALKIEFNYFRITEGVPDSLKMNPVPAPTPVVVKWSSLNKSSFMILSNTEMTVTKAGASYRGGVLGEVRSNRFSVRVDRTFNNSGIHLGFHYGSDINWNSLTIDRRRTLLLSVFWTQVSRRNIVSLLCW